MSMLRCYLAGTFKKAVQFKKLELIITQDLIWINTMLMFKCLDFPSSYLHWRAMFVKDASMLYSHSLI